VVRPEGVEPPAYRFEACRSIQLSYGRTVAECIIRAARMSRRQAVWCGFTCAAFVRLLHLIVARPEFQCEYWELAGNLLVARARGTVVSTPLLSAMA
jgi:hypothetical protein